MPLVPDTNPELRTLLAGCQAADDPMPSLAALSDWLKERDDPRGELVRIWASSWHLDRFSLRSVSESQLQSELHRASPESTLLHWLGAVLGYKSRGQESVEVVENARKAILYVEVRERPRRIPKLLEILQAGWVWHLHISAIEVDDVHTDLLQNTGPIRQISFYQNQSLRNAELQLLQTVPSLRELELTETRISDTGLPRLYPIRSLRLVELRGTRVSDEGRAAFQAALPECVVD